MLDVIDLVIEKKIADPYKLLIDMVDKVALFKKYYPLLKDQPPKFLPGVRCLQNRFPQSDR